MRPDVAHLPDRAAVVAWLDEHAEVGDLAMTACADWVSWVIRTGSGGDFSHVAVVVGDRHLVEAYDPDSTLPDDDGGVYRISFEDFARRGRLRRVGLLRPTDPDFDQKQLTHLASMVLARSPRFSSFSSVLHMPFGLAATRRRWLLPRPLDRWATNRLHHAGDGAERVHCAELATRLYHQSGATPVFTDPRLAKYIERVRDRPIEPVGDGAHRDARVDPTKTLGVIGSLWWAFRTLWRRRHDHDVTDEADLVHPGDFLRSPSFAEVAEATVATEARWWRLRRA